MLVYKSGKQHLEDGMEQSNQEKIRTLGENGEPTYTWASRKLTPSNMRR